MSDETPKDYPDNSLEALENVQDDYLPDLAQVYKTQTLLTASCCLALAFVAFKQVVPFLLGSLIMTLNFMFLVALWRGILDKKHIARTILIVVIKYAILGAVLFIYVREFNLPVMPLIAGLSTLVGTFFVVALQTHFMNRSK